jgi:hypothetical protein
MDKDSEFLIWLAKRLVFRYGENKEILTIVNGIVEKNNAIKKSLDSLNNNISDDINQNIKICYKILDNLKVQSSEIRTTINNVKNEIVLSKFEDLDINSLFRN